jgi:heavy metal translocating P-type ATPase
MNSCSLCGQAALAERAITEGSARFCCHGCRAVYAILSAKNQLEGFEQHPIFLQAMRSGLISNSALLEQIQRQRTESERLPREKVYYEIADMWCPACAELIQLILSKERGVVHCVVDYATDLAVIQFSPQLVSKESLVQAIQAIGYRAVSLDSKESQEVKRSLQWRLAVAAFCSLNIMMFAYPLYATYFDYDGEGYGNLFAWLSFFACVPVLTYSAWPIWRRCTVSLKNGFCGMETLVALGVGAASAVSLQELFNGGNRVYFDSISLVIFFVLLGKMIEGRAKFSAKESLMRLSRATPRRGRKRFSDGRLAFVPLKELAKGDCLVAYTGEKIVLDGIICEGEGAADESLMTGEALPIMKKGGDSVVGGSHLIQGWIAYRTTHSFEESTLCKIIEMVEKDIGHKSAYVRAIDTVARWFVPCVMLLALVTGLVCLLFPNNPLDPDLQRTALLRALSLLLISCPCAIGIAAPAAESYLLNHLARLGVIVRNRGVLPFLGRESILIFDKTGTVTEGRYALLSGLETLSQSKKEVLATLASHSVHPISMAISAALADARRLPLERIEEIAGLGVKGMLEGKEYFLGSERYFSDSAQAARVVRASDEGEIVSRVCFVEEGQLLAQIFLGDRIRPEFPELLAAFKPARALLLSGDAEAAVAAVARRCGFEEWRSGASPLDKRECVEQLRSRGEIVCMLGDGINDAPALTRAHVGISVVSAADISIQVSDLLLATERLNVLKEVRALARKGQRIVKQNLFWAFIYNLIGIPLAMMGLLSPVFAAVAMSLSSICVLLNAKRLE